MSPEDAASLEVATGSVVRVTSRRGQIEVPVRIDESLRPGPHLHDVPLPGRRRRRIILTIDATDPKSGTAEFKATAIRIEKLAVPVGA